MIVVPHGGRARRAQRRRLVRAFRTAGAIAPDRARTLAEMGLAESDVFRAYCRNRVVREGENPGAYYLDEDAMREYEWQILRWALVPIAALLALLLFAIARGTR